MDILLNLIGKFHPLIIHLPIGFILIGLLIEINSKKFESPNKILKFIFLWSSITCFISVLTGFLQYQNEGLLCLCMVVKLFLCSTRSIEGC